MPGFVENVNYIALNLEDMESILIAIDGAEDTLTAVELSAAQVEAAKIETLAAVDNFDDKYLGEFADDPLIDNDGDPLQVGALHYNTTLEGMRVFTGTFWKPVYVDGQGLLTDSNNLSDLADIPTARSNLSVYSTAQVDGLIAANAETVTSLTRIGDLLRYTNEAGVTITHDFSSYRTIVENTLTSYSTISALSAAQGRILQDTKADINHTHIGVYEPADTSILKVADIGVTVQGYDATLLTDADIGVTVQGYDATTLVDADIGTTVQGYNVNTVIEDRSLIAEDNAIDFTKKNFELTATAANITATGLTGTFPREGTILIHSAENITGWGTEFKFKTIPTDLTGDETFGYFIEDALNIWIGRVQ